MAHELCNVMPMPFLKLLLKLCQLKDEVATPWHTLVATSESSRPLCLKKILAPQTLIPVADSQGPPYPSIQ